MKETFSTKLHLSKDNKIRLNIINDILEEYRAEGYKLTLRQLYYQLVSKDIIPNDDKEYKKLGGVLTQGRMAGVVDWNSITDRVRKPVLPYWVTGIEDAMNDTVSQYRLDRMDGQDNYIECWIEKDALSEIIGRVTAKYHIRLMVNRGYSSTSAMYDAYRRFMQAKESGAKNITILYLGDHDPSGLDMIRDIKERILEMLRVGYDTYLNPDPDNRKYSQETIKNWIEASFDVKPLALTTKQVKKYNPPPNPAKLTDPRADWYTSLHGPVSWEVDALNPKTLDALVSNSIESYIDMNLYNTQLLKEAQDIASLRKFANTRIEDSEDE